LGQESLAETLSHDREDFIRIKEACLEKAGFFDTKIEPDFHPPLCPAGAWVFDRSFPKILAGGKSSNQGRPKCVLQMDLLLWVKIVLQFSLLPYSFHYCRF